MSSIQDTIEAIRGNLSDIENAASNAAYELDRLTEGAQVPGHLGHRFPLRAAGGEIIDARDDTVAKLDNTRFADVIVACANAGAWVSQ